MVPQFLLCDLPFWGEGIGVCVCACVCQIKSELLKPEWFPAFWLTRLATIMHLLLMILFGQL